MYRFIFEIIKIFNKYFKIRYHNSINYDIIYVDVKTFLREGRS